MNAMPSHLTRPARRATAIAASLLFAACGSIPTRTLEIRAIDADERPVPCIVVVGGQEWSAAAKNQQFVHLKGDEPLRLPVAFERSEVDIIVAAVPVDGQGQVRQVPRSRPESTDMTGMLADFRRVRVTDPERMLFILRRK
ncbi:MAG: hypothetical protein KF830_15260 [Planctomycetes bacterium]|nr:hypothetical protein [Planctomycetota bacterium]